MLFCVGPLGSKSPRVVNAAVVAHSGSQTELAVAPNGVPLWQYKRCAILGDGFVTPCPISSCDATLPEVHNLLTKDFLISFARSQCFVSPADLAPLS
jgi:hypothetical protein